jgi:type II secretory pathway predicted ATPase ExeA
MRKNKELLAFYGLKYNPFLADIPVGVDMFLYRFENLVANGGFALICGEPGLGKSKVLQLLARRLEALDDVTVGVMERPQSSLNDFYREMGALFGVNLSPANRYGGFKALRERWRHHIKSTLFRPVLLVDEAQEMSSACMNELRLLGSAEFDSKCLLSTVMCGDMRLPEHFRSNTLVALGSRMQFRMTIEPYRSPDLLNYLEHALTQAGSAHLMTKQLKQTLVEHASGNIRLLNNMGAELLGMGLRKKSEQLDQKLYFEVFSLTPRN